MLKYIHTDSQPPVPDTKEAALAEAEAARIELEGLLPELDRVLCDGLDWLLDRWRDQSAPDDARRALARLQEAHRGADIDLVWEKEDYSGAVHYDLLIRAGRHGTVSLSFCPDRAVPWPLRNAFRAPDGWVVKVNGRVIEAATAMTTMDVIWDRTDLVQGLVNLGLADEAVTRRGLTVSDSDLQQAMNAFRRKHRLLSKADTLRYLDAHGMTQGDLERRLEEQVLQDKLSGEVTEGKIEPYFEDHRADFEMAHVARFRVGDQAEAHRIAAGLRAGQADFFEAAQAQFLAGTHTGPTFAVLRRGALSAEQADRVFLAAPGEIVVTPSGEGYDVVRVLRIDSARLDDSTRAQVRQAVFDQWLADARRDAQIIWFWGDPYRLPNQNTGWSGDGSKAGS